MVKILLVVVWIVVPSDLVEGYKVFRSTYCHILQDKKYGDNVSNTLETLVKLHQTTAQYNTL